MIELREPAGELLGGERLDRGILTIRQLPSGVGDLGQTILLLVLEVLHLDLVQTESIVVFMRVNRALVFHHLGSVAPVVLDVEFALLQLLLHHLRLESVLLQTAVLQLGRPLLQTVHLVLHFLGTDSAVLQQFFFGEADVLLLVQSLGLDLFVLGLLGEEAAAALLFPLCVREWGYVETLLLHSELVFQDADRLLLLLVHLLLRDVLLTHQVVHPVLQSSRLVLGLEAFLLGPEHGALLDGRSG